MSHKNDRDREINRHRPFGPDQLSQKYQRLRDAEEPVDLDEEHSTDWSYFDYCWDPIASYGDPWDECIDYCYPNERRTCSPMSQFERKMAQIHAELGKILLHNIGQRVQLEPRRERAPSHVSPAQEIRLDRPEDLAESLRTHCSRYQESPYPEEDDAEIPGLAEFNAVALQPDIRLAIERILSASEYGGLDKVLHFEPFWIRTLDSWTPPATHDPRELIVSLADHLFVYYPVPRFLHNCWQWSRNLDDVWFPWIIILGQGGSLRKASQGGQPFRWTVSKSLQAHLAQVPDTMLPALGCMYAEVLTLGGSEREFNWLTRCGPYVLNPCVSQSDSLVKFWEDTVKWLIRHGDSLDDDRIRDILIWAMHRHTEAERAGAGEPFRWRHRQPARVMEAAAAYRESLIRPTHELKWRPHDWDWDFQDSNDRAWRFTELTTSRALFDEGRAMGHCVASYAGRCTNNSSAIVSLTCEGLRHLTIEVHPASRQIVQARGRFNRSAESHEVSVVAKWKNAVLSQTRSDSA